MHVVVASRILVYVFVSQRPHSAHANRRPAQHRQPNTPAITLHPEGGPCAVWAVCTCVWCEAVRVSRHDRVAKDSYRRQSIHELLDHIIASFMNLVAFLGTYSADVCMV